ncbi:MAG: S-layer homology domain-containing protein [Clostridia bacterium]|nr:S-layer homology domain-containing protein [Clostridia bacterium]
MKKYFGVFLAVLLLVSMIPAPGGAGMLRYDLGKSTFAPSLTETEAVTFVAPGSGSVVLPEATLSATEGDGFVARILKEGNEVVALAVDGGETATMPETKLAVAEGDEITFEADTRGMDGDILTWSPVVLYQGGIAEAEAAPYFIDLANHWSKPYVMPLAEAGIVSGKTANTYDPDGQITRAEFLTLALKVADLPVQVYMPSYADVNENQWFSKVAYVAQKGEIVDPNMVVDNKLLPDQPILREEMTAVIMRVLKVMRGTTIDGAHSFTDGASFAAWAGDYIGQAAKLGIVTGNPDGSFNAKGNATRGEAAVMFSRLKDYLDKTPLFTPHGEYSPVYGAIVYEDVDLNKVINDQIAAGVKEITVAPGAYRLKSQPRGGHIALYDVEGVTINGYGVSILGQTNTTNIFKLENCKDVTINGFTNDYEGGCIFQGQIYNIDPDGFFFDVTVEPGMIQDTKKFITTGMMGSIYEGETGQIVLGTETIMIEPKKMER